MKNDLLNQYCMIVVCKRIMFMLLPFLLNGCFAPAIVTEFNPQCQLATKKLELVVSDEGTEALIKGVLDSNFNASTHCHAPECLLVVPLGALAISTTSLIVSGSIVVVGNTIHWLEKVGRCSQSTLQTIVNQFVGSMKFIGGQTIQSSHDLMTWFKQHLGMLK